MVDVDEFADAKASKLNKKGRLRRKQFNQKYEKSTPFLLISISARIWFGTRRPVVRIHSPRLSTDSTTSKILPHRILFATIASMLYFFTMIPELIPPHEYNYLVKITEENARDQYVIRRILSRLHEARRCCSFLPHHLDWMVSPVRAGTEESDLDVD